MALSLGTSKSQLNCCQVSAAVTFGVVVITFTIHKEMQDSLPWACYEKIQLSGDGHCTRICQWKVSHNLAVFYESDCDNQSSAVGRHSWRSAVECVGCYHPWSSMVYTFSHVCMSVCVYVCLQCYHCGKKFIFRTQLHLKVIQVKFVGLRSWLQDECDAATLRSKL